MFVVYHFRYHAYYIIKRINSEECKDRLNKTTTTQMPYLRVLDMFSTASIPNAVIFHKTQAKYNKSK